MALDPADAFFDEVLDFLASSPTAEQLVNYRPPTDLQQRLSELLDKNRRARLSEVEQAEMEEFRQIDHLLTLIKAKARLRLKAQHE
jgi:hypothetical protein